MKLLSKLLLINWHYFKHQLLELEQINFLTGVNASGKSTLIDALQMLLLGDTSGTFFNKAANDKSRRSLKGYLRGEMAEDETNGLIYLRNGTFTSYVVGEFWDQRKQQSFCLGAVFDCQASGEYQHRFFSLEGELPADHFISQQIPRSLNNLKSWGKAEKLKLEIFETNQRYRELFRGKMGNLSEKFFQVLKKSVPFSPIMDIKGFISEFVCASQGKMEIGDMLENIRYYRQLENEQGLVKQKIAELREIEASFASLTSRGEQIKLYRYALARLSWEAALLKVRQTKQEILRLEKRAAQIELELQENQKAQQEQESLKEKYGAARTASGLLERFLHLKAEQEQLQMQADLKRQSQNRLAGFLERSRLIWQNVGELERQAPLYPDWNGLQAAVDCLNNLDLSPNPEAWQGIAQVMQDFGRFYGGLSHQTQEEIKRIQKKLELLGGEIQELTKGVKAYSKPLLGLQAAIKAELQRIEQVEIQPEIFADLIEVRDEKWRDALEGFLAGSKFNLLIEPRYFKTALRVYERLKFQQEFYDLGLVDLAKVQQQNPAILPGSLAEELITENPQAQVYLNFLLGKVMKCEKAEDLPNFRTAITPTAMLYQRFVVRQINPSRYRRPFIGTKASLEQIRQKKQELANWEQKLASAQESLKLYQKFSQLAAWNENDLNNLAEWSASSAELAELEKLLAAKAAERLEMKELEEIEVSLAQVQSQIQELSQHKDRLLNERGRTESKLEITRLRWEEEGQEALAKEAMPEFSAQWREAWGEPWFEQEVINSDWENRYTLEIEAAILGFQEERDRLLQLRGQYNRQYKVGWDLNSEDNQAWEKARQRLEESSLNLYGEKIRLAREKAQQQFQEDFISKLRESIENVERQILELNLALKEIPFGQDRYYFRVIPNPQQLKYYRMIMSDLLLQGQTVFSEQFQAKYGETVEALFNQLLTAGEDPNKQTERELAYYTDYRTYLDFDLMVLDGQGNQSRLSRVLNKKSGGETQTPFYLAVLASFCQIYRIRQSGLNHTLRLIIFDEAFNKMDHQRIRESIGLVRQLGLQLIISAPTEKIADIAPLVDRNLCLTRIGQEAFVKFFDPQKLKA